MQLGQRLLQARQEAGLSQRELCGDTITRNMLSQIEHGTARPSMSTLQVLAARLQKPMSYFLGEESAAVSGNTRCMEAAREALNSGDLRALTQALDAYQAPDPMYDWQFLLLRYCSLLRQAGTAIGSGKQVFAQNLLASAEELEPHLAGIPGIPHDRLLLLGQCRSLTLKELPKIDADLMLRARACLAERAFGKACSLLDAAEDQEDPNWHLLRGRAAMGLADYQAARDYLLPVGKAGDRRAYPLLELCSKELGDFQSAYEYACLQRQR